jgi:hypothetical protein
MCSHVLNQISPSFNNFSKIKIFDETYFSFNFTEKNVCPIAETGAGTAQRCLKVVFE